MTWNPLLQEMVVFGGNGATGYENDIWSYNATTTGWTEIDPQVNCPGNTGFSKPNGTDDTNFKYDPVNNLYWIFGANSGYRCLSFAVVRTAAAGTTETSLIDSNLPASDSGAYTSWNVKVGNVTVGVSAYDGPSKTLTLAQPIAGLTSGSTYVLYAHSGAGVWYFDPITKAWTGQNTPAGNIGPIPTGARIAAAVAYSDKDEAFVLFAGKATGTIDKQVWRLDVRSKLWTQLPLPASGTPPHMRELLNSFVYDKQNDIFILFGGVCYNDPICTDGGKQSQTWSYHLPTNTWTNLNPANSPSARAQHVMAYDSEHGIVTLFGGATAAGGLANDTWYYHYPSNTWTQVNTSTTPTGRYLAQITYDPILKRSVVFGGQTSTSMQSDIWALKLTSSTNVPPTVSILSPGAGSNFVAPANITLSANASDSDGSISKVEYFQGANKIGESLAAPFSVAWNNIPAGSYSITAQATDNNGASTNSSVVSVTVTPPPNQAPIVSLSSPSSGSSFTAPASITLTAAASDPDGSIAKVEYFQGSTKIGEAITTPFSVVWNNVAAGSYSITARATDSAGASTTSAAVGIAVNSPTGGTPINVALASNGGVATASSNYSTAYPAAAVIDGNRKGNNWGNGGGWNDGTQSAFPDWLQVNFNGVKSINSINIFTLADNYASLTEPTTTTTFTKYGITQFQVQYWNGAAWVTVPNGSITGNNLVWRTISFPVIGTDRIRVTVADALYWYSRIVEVEVWSSSTP